MPLEVFLLDSVLLGGLWQSTYQALNWFPVFLPVVHHLKTIKNTKLIASHIWVPIFVNNYRPIINQTALQACIQPLSILHYMKIPKLSSSTCTSGSLDYLAI